MSTTTKSKAKTEVTAELVAQLRDANDAEAAEILNEFIREHEQRWPRMAVMISAKSGGRVPHDEALSVVYHAFLEMAELLKRSAWDSPQSVFAMVAWRATQLIHDEIAPPASGMTTLRRRHQELRGTRDALLAEHGGEPSAEAVVDATNERLLARLKDVRRQGMWCTVEDYHLMGAAHHAVELTELNETGTPDPNESAAPIHAVDRERLVRITVARCREISPEHGLVAEAFFGSDLAASFEGPPTSSDISQAVGLAAPTVRRKVAEVKQVAREILADEFGITRAA